MGMLKTLRKFATLRAKEWGTTVTDASFRGNELAGEAGEVCNEIKKLERHRLGLVGGKTDLTGLQEELGDLVICAELIAQHYDIDLEEAIKDKFNKTSKKYGLKTVIK